MTAANGEVLEARGLVHFEPPTAQGIQLFAGSQVFTGGTGRFSGATGQADVLKGFANPATLEGGYSWPIQARLIRPSLAVVSVKDFVWTRNAATNRWNTDWCPIGEGLVQPEFFKYLKSTRYAGPICQHFEYEIGQGKAMIHALKKDQETLKQWLRNV